MRVTLSHRHRASCGYEDALCRYVWTIPDVRALAEFHRFAVAMVGVPYEARPYEPRM